MAQGILESIESTLVKKGNNHFGIKCHKDWKGKKFFMMTMKRMNVLDHIETL